MEPQTEMTSQGVVISGFLGFRVGGSEFWGQRFDPNSKCLQLFSLKGPSTQCSYTHPKTCTATTNT